MKEFYDMGKSPSDITIGDWVLVNDKPRADALEPVYKGPWTVIERKGVNLQVQCANTGRKSVVHNGCKKILPGSPDIIIGNIPDADKLSCLGEEDQRTSISQNQVPVPVPQRRSSRERKPPLRFRDPMV